MPKLIDDATFEQLRIIKQQLKNNLLELADEKFSPRARQLLKDSYDQWLSLSAALSHVTDVEASGSIAPQPKSQDQQRAQNPPPTSSAPPKGDSWPRVLVIDDCQLTQKLLAYSFAKSELKVKGLTNPEDTSEVIKSFQPDAIILDLLMPEMSGWEVLKSIRTHAEYDHIPVIIGSSKNQPEDKKKALEYGANDFLSKPYNIDELINRLRHKLAK